MVKERLAKRSASFNRRCVALVLCVGSVYGAGAVQTPGASFQTSPAAEETYVSQRSAPAGNPDADTRQTNSRAGAKRSHPSNQDPAPATVVLENGKLTVEANNSDLAEILRTVAAVTGMTIDGSIRSSRVFGVYGPRNPRDVLTDLLEGTGYNFMMVGGTRDGAPRQLLLSAEKSKSAPGPAAVATRNPETPDVKAEEPLGPGAIAHVPPPPPEDTQERVRQNLQRLRQMQEKLKQQNAPQ